MKSLPVPSEIFTLSHLESTMGADIVLFLRVHPSTAGGLTMVLNSKTLSLAEILGKIA